MSSSDDDRTTRRQGRRNDLDSEIAYTSRGSDRTLKDGSTSKRGSNADRGSRRESRDDINRSRRYRDQPRDSESREERRAKNDYSERHRRYRERSRSRERSHRRSRSKSPPTKRRRRSDSASVSPRPDRRSRAPLPSQNEAFGGDRGVAPSDGPPVEKQKPNYKPSGLLAKEANTVAGTTTVLKYHEPPEARKPPPKEQWRMYVFKKKDLLDTVYLHQRSVWLLGRDQTVTDVLLEHPSISKQHAVIQFRYLTSTNEFGDKTSKVKPYLIDLESANGTSLNGKKIEASRYVELVDGDVVGFGDSEREYVLMLPPVDK